MLELVYGELPNRSIKHVSGGIVLVPPMENKNFKEITHLAKKCLKKDPSKRISLQTIEAAVNS